MEVFGQTQITIVAHVAIAMALGALLGLDREFEQKPAGLRTHMLVAGAAAFLLGLADLVVTHSGLDVSSGLIRTDPIRIIQAIITGVSFLGAGTIIRHGTGNGGDGEVEGLTTAASLLFAATIGISVALSQITLAIATTFLALFTLRGISIITEWIKSRKG